MKQKLASKQFWEKMLVYSCKTKDIELFELSLKKGAQNYDKSMSYACLLGQGDMAERLIALGAEDLNEGLKKAFEGGSYEIGKMLIEKGATSVEGRDAKEFWNEIFEDQKSFFLYVDLDGERTLFVSISAESTVMDLKRVIEEKEGIIPVLQKLNFEGIHITGARTLSDYNLEKGSTIRLTSVRRRKLEIKIKFFVGGKEIPFASKFPMFSDVARMKIFVEKEMEIPEYQQEWSLILPPNEGEEPKRLAMIGEKEAEPLFNIEGFDEKTSSFVVEFDISWKMEEHHVMNNQAKEFVFTFLLSMKRALEKRLKLPKPILSIIISLAL